MNLKSLSALGAGLLLAACSQAPRTDSLTQYVDMRIGTGGHGHVFMGANVPFGAVQLGPTSIPQSWDWTSGYHISDTTVIGFSHTHLNGTGIGDLFDVTVMPVVGQVTYARGTEDDPQSGMWSYFSHANEKARPGYYATRLDRYGIDVELTATKRVGLHKYTFPASADAAVVFDLENGGCWDAPTETFIERADDHTISGYLGVAPATGRAGRNPSGSISRPNSPNPSSRWPFTRAARAAACAKATASGRSAFTAESVSTLRPERRSMSRSPFRP